MKFTLKEMNGLLNGKCLPSDLIAGETLAVYLVREFSELEQRLIESERYGRQTDITIDNLERKVAQLAAENAGLKQAITTHSQSTHFCEVCGKDDPCSTDDVCYVLNETPATDAFLAEVRAQGVEMFADDLLCPDLDNTIREFAEQLRKGVQS